MLSLRQFNLAGIRRLTHHTSHSLTLKLSVLDRDIVVMELTRMRQFLPTEPYFPVPPQIDR